MPQLTWLIVGATFGFGEALVRQLLEKGDNVIATAAQKSRQLLDLELAGATVVELDMSQSMYYLSRKLDDLLPIYDGLDVLVINRDFRVTTSGRRLRCVFTTCCAYILLMLAGCQERSSYHRGDLPRG